jgi:xanthine dioxygenase
MFDILPPELKSVAVRSKVRYAPHPYVWMAPARSNTLGLGLLTENKELSLSELPEWSEDKIKSFPMVSILALNQTSNI